MGMPPPPTGGSDIPAAAAGGRLLGTNSLQAAIDKFAESVNRLSELPGLGPTSAYPRQQPGPAPSASGSYGNTGYSAQQQQNNFATQAFPQMYNPFRSPNMRMLNLGAPGAGGYSTAPPGGFITPAPTLGNLGQAQQAWQQQTGFGQSPAMGQPGPGWVPPGLFGQQAVSNGGWGATVRRAAFSAAGGFTLGAAAGAAVAYGTAQLPQQTAANTQAYLSGMGYSGNGATPWYTQAFYRTAYGANNIGLNDLAMNMTDATQGMATLQATAGSMNPYLATPLGRTVRAAAGGVGFANPAMSFAQNTGLISNIYSPAFSMRMLQMGYGTQPLRLGGGQNPLGQVIRGLVGRGFGTNNVTMNQLQGGLARNFGASLGALGLNPQQTQALAQTITAYQRVYERTGSYDYAQKLFNAATNSAGFEGMGQKTATDALGKLGFGPTDIQAIKNRQAALTGRAADVSGGFNSALQHSTDLLNRFGQVITGIMDKLGGNNIIGGIGGLSASSLLGKIPVVGGALSSIGRLFGGAMPAAGGSTNAAQLTAGRGTAITNSVSAAAKKAVQAAEMEVGVPYLWGGEQPGVGFDCSGLMQWAYGQAGIRLPRTSEQQWAFLRNRAVNLNQVEEGDLVFMAGSDGTPNNPGHVGMMISQHQLIQAPHTGTDVQIIGYNPRDWSHAGRPSGSMKGSSSAAGTGGASLAGQMNPSRVTGVQGNTGTSSGLGGYSGSYGSSNELAALSSASSSGTTGAGTPGITLLSASTTGGPGGTGKGSGGGKPGATTANLSGNRKIMNIAAAKYGWGTGREWAALNNLEMHEAGYNNFAQNPTSTAYGMGQFLDSTWATVGGHKTSNPVLQADYMMKYIRQRYGDPIHAWAQYFQHPGGVGWYGTGGRIPGHKGQWAITGERGPELAHFPEGTDIYSHAALAKMLKAANTQPAQAPWTNLDTQAGMFGDTQAGGTHVSVNFGQNAIVIQGASFPNTQGLVQSLGSEIGNRVVDAMARKQRINAVASGVK